MKLLRAVQGKIPPNQSAAEPNSLGTDVYSRNDSRAKSPSATSRRRAIRDAARLVLSRRAFAARESISARLLLMNVDELADRLDEFRTSRRAAARRHDIAVGSSLDRDKFQLRPDFFHCGHIRK